MTEEYNLYPLHVFRVVARLGSVTRAAEALCISQPAVSSHLKTLQARYREMLLERTPRGMLLTPAGAVVAEHANRVFALLEDTATAVEATRGEVKGNVTLAASSTPGAYLVPRLLRRFQDHYPDAKATLLVGDSTEALSWLRDFRVALGVVGETVSAEGLYREQIAQDELRLVVAATDNLGQIGEITSEHLAGQTLFLREPGSSTRAGAETLLCGWMGGFTRVIEQHNTEAIKQAVIAGLGMAVLSSWATQLEEQAGLLRPVRDARFRQGRKFYAVRRADRTLVGAAAALWQCLASCSSA
jgi:DNA-binding transcriptional LysR family regulator